MKSAIILLFGIMTALGCSTVRTKAGDGEWGHKFSGTRCNLETIQLMASLAPPVVPLFLPDLVVSAVADTIVAPFEVFASTVHVHHKCGSLEGL